MKYIGLDCEFGGFEPQHSLLTVGLSVTDSEFQEIDSLHLNVFPPGGNYIVNAEAMEVNGIDLVEHSRTALPVDKCSEEIKKFLKRHGCIGVATDEEGNKREVIKHLTVVGHAVQGDIDRIKSAFPNCKWARYCGFKYIDTLQIGWILKDLGVIDPHLKLGLSSVVSKAIPAYRFKAHNALEDARASLTLLSLWRRFIMSMDKGVPSQEFLNSELVLGEDYYGA